jgi:hypothetical protein
MQVRETVLKLRGCETGWHFFFIKIFVKILLMLIRLLRSGGCSNSMQLKERETILKLRILRWAVFLFFVNIFVKILLRLFR